jgi:broad specificity phosphatase PhoE
MSVSESSAADGVGRLARGKGAAPPSTDYALRFVAGQWRAPTAELPSEIEIRMAVGEADAVGPGDVSGIVGEFCAALGLPEPQLTVVPARDLPEGEFEVRAGGATRLAGTLATTRMRWWAHHPGAGPGGRTGAFDHAAPGEGKMAPLEAVGRAIEEVLWDDPGLVLTGGAAVNRLLARLGEHDAGALASASLDGWSDVLRRVAARRIPLGDSPAVCSALEASARPSARVWCVEELASRLHPNDVRIRLGRGLHDRVFDKEGAKDLEERLEPMLRDGLYYELGVAYPEFKFERTSDLPDQGYQITVNRLPRASGSVPVGRVLVNADAAAVDDLDPRAWINPANGGPCSWVPEEKAADPAVQRFTTWNAREYLILQLAACLREAAVEFADLAWTERQVGRLREYFPETVAITERFFDARNVHASTQLAAVCHRLVGEGLALRNLTRVLNRIVEFEHVANSALVLDPDGAPREVDWSMEDPISLTEYVRGGMKDYISHARSNGGTMVALLLDGASVEEKLAAVVHTSAGYEPVYGYEDAGSFLRELRNTLEGVSLTQSDLSLLTGNDLRPHLRRLIAAQFPTLAVVSYQELAPTLSIQPLSRISLE